MMYDFYGGGWVMMVFFWLLVTVGILLLVMWVVNQTKTNVSTEQNALEILKQRYVNGEINKDEFEEKKADLTS